MEYEKSEQTFFVDVHCEIWSHSQFSNFPRWVEIILWQQISTNCWKTRGQYVGSFKYHRLLKTIMMPRDHTLSRGEKKTEKKGSHCLFSSLLFHLRVILVISICFMLPVGRILGSSLENQEQHLQWEAEQAISWTQKSNWKVISTRICFNSFYESVLVFKVLITKVKSTATLKSIWKQFLEIESQKRVSVSVFPTRQRFRWNFLCNGSRSCAKFGKVSFELANSEVLLIIHVKRCWQQNMEGDYLEV